MRTGVFFQSSDQQLGEHVLEALKAARITAAAYAFGRRWEDLDPGELQFNLHSVSLIIMIPATDAGRARWPAFLSGFALGSKQRLCVYRPEASTSLPGYMGKFPVMSSLAELTQFVLDESVILVKAEEIEQAREEIAGLGLPLTEDGFATKVMEGDLDIIGSYLQYGFSCDTRDSRGVPVLSLAIRTNNRDAFNELLTRGADVNAVSADRGNTPLMEAAARDDAQIVKRLLEHGADPNVRSVNGQTALMMAVGQGNDEIALALLAAGANADVVDELGMTARKYAALFRRTAVVEALEAQTAQRPVES